MAKAPFTPGPGATQAKPATTTPVPAKAVEAPATPVEQVAPAPAKAETVTKKEDIVVMGPVIESAPEIMVKPSGDVFVANQHTGGITFPMRGEGGIVVPPLRLAPGQVTRVPADEWEKRKRMLVVQYYLDKRILVEVQQAAGVVVPMTSETSSELIIPENLQTDAEAMQGQMGSAAITKANAGQVTIG